MPTLGVDTISSLKFDKREKFDHNKAEKKREGVFEILFRPEGKMLSKLTANPDLRLPTIQDNELKERKSPIKGGNKVSSTLIAHLVRILQNAIKSLKTIKPAYLETEL